MSLSIEILLANCDLFVTLGEKVTEIYYESVYRDLTVEVRNAGELLKLLKVGRWTVAVAANTPEGQEEELKSGLNTLAELMDVIKKYLDNSDKQGLNEKQRISVDHISKAIDDFIRDNPRYKEEDFIDGEVTAFKAWKDERSSTESH